ncbi:MAG: hercynine oxygenase [Acidimicrobiales bacterium]|nr:MAG: hercynine oxygenase [Acidimicrobiales bacterium]
MTPALRGRPVFLPETADHQEDLDGALRRLVATWLEECRRRTLSLLDDLPEEAQRSSPSPIMSPPVWDLAHIANYEELWLLRALDGREPTDPALDDMYNAFEHPRWERPSLPLLGPREARAYAASIRLETFDLLRRIDVEASPELLSGAFVYRMLVQHEHQHDETILQTRQMRGERCPPVYGALRAEDVGLRGDPTLVGTEVVFRGGSFEMGTSTDPWAYDNERPAHTVQVGSFALGATPVTCGEWIEFIRAGGYERSEYWSEDGWHARRQHGWTAPMYWRRGPDGTWGVLRHGRWLAVDPTEPVQHVSFYEAEAFCRWRGGRLPTEAEWEYAARSLSEGETTSAANTGTLFDGPAPVGSLPGAVTSTGLYQMIGCVWEWTSTPFGDYPGFRAFPYKEYSEVFFGSDYRVLRGGSWATHPTVARVTFRNWDFPRRRQIFAGVRIARDV